MNKNINHLINETLESFAHLQKVEVPAGIEERILQRINQPKGAKEVYLFRNPQWLIAALVIGIVCNVWLAISYNNKVDSSNTETSTISSFESHFGLETTTDLYE